MPTMKMVGQGLGSKIQPLLQTAAQNPLRSAGVAAGTVGTAGAGGYGIGKIRGRHKERAKTAADPIAPSGNLQSFYAKNPYLAAGLMSRIPLANVVGAATMPKGHRLGTFGHVVGGGLAGGVGGGMLGGALGALTRNPLLAARLGSFGGGVTGAALVGGSRIRRAFDE